MKEKEEAINAAIKFLSDNGCSVAVFLDKEIPNAINTAIKFLRDNGCAVAVFLDKEIPKGIDVDELENIMEEAGADYIDSTLL